MENMVNLTEFNTEATPIGGTVPGVIFTLPAMEKVYIHDSEYDGLPAELTSISGLTRLYLNGNLLTSLPDMSEMTWGDGAKIRVQNNKLTFEDLEPNVAVASDMFVAEFNYSPQANVGMPAAIDLMMGETLNLSVDVGGSANIYTWITGEDTVIEGATETTYQKEGVTVEDALSYKALIQSNLVPGLDIFSEVFTVTVDGVSSITEQQFEGLKVLGNPVENILRLESQEPIEFLQVYDITGKLLMESIIKNTSVNLPVHQLDAGIYFVVLRAEDKLHTVKVIKK